MFLLDSNRSIIAKLLVAAPTTQPDFNTSYSDRTGAPQVTWTEGMNDGTLNDTNEVTIVAAPSAGNIRYVRNIQIQNPNTSQITVIIELANGASRRIIRQIDVIAKGTVEWDSESGWLTATTMTIVNGLTSGIITSGFIGNNAVTSGNIASGAVGQFQLASGAVVSGVIASGQVSTNAIASGSIISFADGLIDDDRDSLLLTAETISGVRVVSLTTSGALQIAMANNPARLPPIGIVTANVASGQVATVLKQGRIYNSAFNFSGQISNPVYLGLSGSLQVAQPAGAQASGTISGSFPNWNMGAACSVSGLVFNQDLRMYGNDIQFVEDTSNSTTTSASLVDKLILTTPALTGTYQIDFVAEISNTASNGKSQLVFANTTDSLQYYNSIILVGGANFYQAISGFEQIVFSGVAKTFKIQHAANTSTSEVRNCRIRIRRVA